MPSASSTRSTARSLAPPRNPRSSSRPVRSDRPQSSCARASDRASTSRRSAWMSSPTSPAWGRTCTTTCWSACCTNRPTPSPRVSGTSWRASSTRAPRSGTVPRPTCSPCSSTSRTRPTAAPPPSRVTRSSPERCGRTRAARSGWHPRMPRCPRSWTRTSSPTSATSRRWSTRSSSPAPWGLRTPWLRSARRSSRRVPTSRRGMNCATTPGGWWAPITTRSARAGWAGTPGPSSIRTCGCAASRACASRTPRSCPSCRVRTRTRRRS